MADRLQSLLLKYTYFACLCSLRSSHTLACSLGFQITGNGVIRLHTFFMRMKGTRDKVLSNWWLLREDQQGNYHRVTGKKVTEHKLCLSRNEKPKTLAMSSTLDYIDFKVSTYQQTSCLTSFLNICFSCSALPLVLSHNLTVTSIPGYNTNNTAKIIYARCFHTSWRIVGYLYVGGWKCKFLHQELWLDRHPIKYFYHRKPHSPPMSIPYNKNSVPEQIRMDRSYSGKFLSSCRINQWISY